MNAVEPVKIAILGAGSRSAQNYGIVTDYKFMKSLNVGRQLVEVDDAEVILNEVILKRRH